MWKHLEPCMIGLIGLWVGLAGVAVASDKSAQDTKLWHAWYHAVFLLCVRPSPLLLRSPMLHHDSSPALHLQPYSPHGFQRIATPNHPAYNHPTAQVQGFYTSYSFIDDLTWAAAWLALATGDQYIKEEARLYWLRFITDEGGGEGRRCPFSRIRV